MSDKNITRQEIHDNNRNVIGYQEYEQVPANNDRENKIVFNTHEIPVAPPVISKSETPKEEQDEITDQILLELNDKKGEEEV